VWQVEASAAHSSALSQPRSDTIDGFSLLFDASLGSFNVVVDRDDSSQQFYLLMQRYHITDEKFHLEFSRSFF
jgi:hypothetical protein